MRPPALLLALLLCPALRAQTLPAVDFDGAARGVADSPFAALARKPRPKPEPTPSNPDAPAGPSGTTMFHGVALPARAFSRVDGIPSMLVEAIDATQSSLYLALYELNLNEVAAAVVRAKERGVDVKLIYDMGHGEPGDKGVGGEGDGGGLEAEAAGPSSEYTALVHAGVETRLLRGGGSYGIMHNKVAVFDGELVVTGSFNWSTAADQENFENAVFRNDPSLAQLYTSYFNWMWPLGKPVDPGIISGTPTFGAFQAESPFPTPPSDPSPSVQYKGSSWPRAVYSPNGGAEAKLAEAISQARSTVDMAIFSFYSPAVAEAVRTAAGRGVTVRVVADKSQAKRSPQIADLAGAGVPLRLSSGRGGHGVLHHKFTVIDGELVELGSFNYSENAEKNNFENQFYTADGDDVVGYEAEFKAVWAQAHDPQPGEIEGTSTGTAAK